MIKKIITAIAPAIFASLAQVAYAQTTDWSGGYAGFSLNIDAQTASGPYDHNDYYTIFGGDIHPSLTGAIGHNWQIGQFVYGAELLATLNNSSNRILYDDVSDPDSLEYNLNWSATLRGRAGITSGNALFYGALGIGYADLDMRNCYQGFNPCQVDNSNLTNDGNAIGLSFAIGTEFSVSERLSLFLEYQRTNYFSEETFTIVGGAITDDPAQFSFETDSIRFGVNYAFAPRGFTEQKLANETIWAGTYAGILATGAVILDDSLYNDAGTRFHEFDATLTGVIGRNWQIGDIVFGLEADLTGPLSSGKTWYDGDFVTELDYNWTATLRGRFGISTGNALFFVTGGLAAADTNFIGCETGDTLPCSDPGALFIDRLDEVIFGFSVGFGIDYALSDQLSLRAEYLHISYPIEYPQSDGSPSSPVVPISSSLNMARVGLTYKFAPGTAQPSDDQVDWSGTYTGAFLSGYNLGVAGGHPSAYTGIINDHSLAFGATLGRNWQSSGFVYGLEADIQTGMQDTQATMGLSGGSPVVTAHWNWAASLRARAGIATGKALLYTTAGVSIANVDLQSCDEDDFNAGTCFSAGGDNFNHRLNDTLVGIAAGFGAEYMLRDNMSLKAEYLFQTYPSETGEVNDPTTLGDFHTWSHQLKLGVNYHF